LDVAPAERHDRRVERGSEHGFRVGGHGRIAQISGQQRWEGRCSFVTIPKRLAGVFGTQQQRRVQSLPDRRFGRRCRCFWGVLRSRCADICLTCGMDLCRQGLWQLQSGQFPRLGFRAQPVQRPSSQFDHQVIGLLTFHERRRAQQQLAMAVHLPRDVHLAGLVDLAVQPQQSIALPRLSAERRQAIQARDIGTIRSTAGKSFERWGDETKKTHARRFLAKRRCGSVPEIRPHCGRAGSTQAMPSLAASPEMLYLTSARDFC
jgi:hypothetical protein